jgi:hypothetical protein
MQIKRERRSSGLICVNAKNRRSADLSVVEEFMFEIAMRLRSFTDAVSDRWAEWRARRARVAELAGCGTAEAIARDLHLPAGELKLLAGRGAGSADLLYVRLAALGMSPERIQVTMPEVMRDMQRCCSGCTEKERCAHELDNVPGAPMAYCPNSDTLDALKMMKGR